MRIIKYILTILIILLPITVLAQTDSLDNNIKHLKKDINESFMTLEQLNTNSASRPMRQLYLNKLAIVTRDLNEISLIPTTSLELQNKKNQTAYLALKLMMVLNSQNHLGFDYFAERGKNIFIDVNDNAFMHDRVIPRTENSGNAEITVAIQDFHPLAVGDYDLIFDSPKHYLVLRLRDNQVVSSGDIQKLPISFTCDGMNITLQSATIKNNDTYTLSPLRNVLSQIAMVLDDPYALALAMPIIAETSSSNNGTGMLNISEINDMDNDNFLIPVSITALSSATFIITNADTHAVIDGPYHSYDGNLFPTPNGFDPGYRAILRGDPQEGDTFTLKQNQRQAATDNLNGLLLANLYRAEILKK